MKRLIALAFTLYNCFVQAEDSITLVGGEWPPYVSESLKHLGIAPRILTEVFGVENIKVKYRFYTWARALEMVRKGEADGTFLWSKNPEREKEFMYSQEPIGSISYVFFHLKDNPFNWQSFEDLKGKRIAATIGYHYSDEFNTADKDKLISVTRVNSDLQLLKMLFKRRVDIIPHDLTVGYFEINMHFPPSAKNLFTNHSLPIKQKASYLLLSKKIEKNQKILSLFNKAFSKFKASGKFDKYYFDDLLSGVYKQ